MPEFDLNDYTPLRGNGRPDISHLSPTWQSLIHLERASTSVEDFVGAMVSLAVSDSFISKFDLVLADLEEVRQRLLESLPAEPVEPEHA